MATTITLPRRDLPIAVPMAGGLQTSGDWYRWARDITARVGGVTGTSTEDLSVSQSGGAGIEETKAALSMLANEAGQFPAAPSCVSADDPLTPAPFALAAVAEDPSSEIASLREELATLRSRLDAIEQGNEQ